MKFILTCITAFISTNIDDTFLLMLFLRDKRFKPGQILVGQLLGIWVLIGISLLLSLVGLLIGKAYIGLLGLAPIYLGVRGLIKLFRNSGDDDQGAIAHPSGRGNVLSVAGVTIANGGDNIGTYTPLLATVGWSQKAIMITIFLVLTVALYSLEIFYQASHHCQVSRTLWSPCHTIRAHTAWDIHRLREQYNEPLST